MLAILNVNLPLKIKLNKTMDLLALKENYKELYGKEADYLFFSPGRVNLIGEHTDYNGGYVFPCAINYGTYLLAGRNNGCGMRFASMNMELRADITCAALNQKQPGGAWVNYPLGVMHEFAKLGVKVEGLDLLYCGNIPNGAGLSSSASIEMVTSVMINELFNKGALEMMEMVKLSQRAENQFVGVNSGIMDQFAVGMGLTDHALALKCDTLEYQRVPLKLQGCRIVVSNTNKRRGLADSKYNERRAECEKALEEMNSDGSYKFLSDLDLNKFDSLKGKLSSDVLLRRARHVITENQRVLDAMAALENYDLAAFGNLMNASHVSLRDDYEVTGKELDALVEEAWKVEGVFGSRMTGAGFGGCTVSIVKEEAIDRFIEQVGKEYERRTGLKPDFYIAEVGDGARRLE